MSPLDQRRKKPWLDQIQIAMDYDLEDGILIREEGKKRNRGEMEGLTEKEGSDNDKARNRKMVEFNLVSSAVATRQADRAQ